VPNDKPLGAQLGWQLENTAYLYTSPWLKIRQDTFSRGDQPQGVYTYIEHPGSVLVVPFTVDRRVLLIRSYRYTLDLCCWEIPAGTLCTHIDDSPQAAALRELREEAGITCSALYGLGSFYLGNGYANHLAHFFAASDAKITLEPKREPFEQIDAVSSFSITEVEDLIRMGTMNDGDSALAILLALQWLRAEPLMLSAAPATDPLGGTR
jgi:8-oxo-dGTP pyrophosphatase MutT (NUDIX family)